MTYSVNVNFVDLINWCNETEEGKALLDTHYTSNGLLIDKTSLNWCITKGIYAKQTVAYRLLRNLYDTHNEEQKIWINDNFALGKLISPYTLNLVIPRWTSDEGESVAFCLAKNEALRPILTNDNFALAKQIDGYALNSLVNNFYKNESAAYWLTKTPEILAYNNYALTKLITEDTLNALLDTGDSIVISLLETSAGHKLLRASNLISLIRKETVYTKIDLGCNDYILKRLIDSESGRELLAYNNFALAKKFDLENLAESGYYRLAEAILDGKLQAHDFNMRKAKNNLIEFVDVDIVDQVFLYVLLYVLMKQIEKDEYLIVDKINDYENREARIINASDYFEKIKEKLICYFTSEKAGDYLIKMLAYKIPDNMIEAILSDNRMCTAAIMYMAKCFIKNIDSNNCKQINMILNTITDSDKLDSKNKKEIMDLFYACPHAAEYAPMCKEPNEECLNKDMKPYIIQYTKIFLEKHLQSRIKENYFKVNEEQESNNVNSINMIPKYF